MKPTKQVRVLIGACFASCAFNLVFCVVAVRTILHPVEYQISVRDAPDLSFLDLLTNRLESAQTLTNSVESVRSLPPSPTPSSALLPIVFDSYTIAGGVSYAGYRGHYIRSGDFLLGQLCEDVTPWAVKVGGNLYPITERKGFDHDRISNDGDTLR